MKKRIVIFLIFVLVVSGCGNKDNLVEKLEEKEIEEATQEAFEDLGEEVNIVTDDGTTTITTEDGGEFMVATDLDSGVPVPDDYPSDVLPIYSEEYIALATSTEGSFSLAGYTNDSFEDVIAYYEDAVSDGAVLIKEMDDEYYMNMGDLMGKTYSITITTGENDTDYKTNFTLVVMPSMGTLPGVTDTETTEESDEQGQVSNPSEEAPLIIPDNIVWPEDYPEEDLPVYPRGATEVDTLDAGGDLTMVSLKTEDLVDDVYDYYVGLFSDSSDFSEMKMSPMILLSGTINGESYNITLIENGVFTDVDLKYNTLIQIDY